MIQFIIFLRVSEKGREFGLGDGGGAEEMDNYQIQMLLESSSVRHPIFECDSLDGLIWFDSLKEILPTRRKE